MYHLLRRHALAEDRKPLIVMTPKTRLYGVQESYSPLCELAQGEFHPLLAERDGFDPALVTSVVITSGKLCYDLLSERSQRRVAALPMLRVEQLYPFPSDALVDELKRYPRLREVVWAQEEAKNHGAWHGIRDALEMALPPSASLRYAGRPAAAPTATCDPAQHEAELHALVTSALGSQSA